jgi:hypothetical protein
LWCSIATPATSPPARAVGAVELLLGEHHRRRADVLQQVLLADEASTLVQAHQRETGFAQSCTGREVSSTRKSGGTRSEAIATSKAFIARTWLGAGPAGGAEVAAPGAAPSASCRG